MSATARSYRSGCGLIVIGLVGALAILLVSLAAFQRGPLHAIDCYFSSRDGWAIAYPTEPGSLSQFRASIRKQSRNCVGVVVRGPTDDDAEVVSPIGTSTWVSSGGDRSVFVSTRTDR